MDDDGEVKRGIKAKASTVMAHRCDGKALGLIQVGGLEGQHATWGPDLQLAGLVIASDTKWMGRTTIAEY